MIQLGIDNDAHGRFHIELSLLCAPSRKGRAVGGGRVRKETSAQVTQASAYTVSS